MNDWIVSLEAARTEPVPAGRRSVKLRRHGTMPRRYCAPKGEDLRPPHDRDEIYIVQSGTGTVLSGPTESQLERKSFGPGDAIFVPAQYVHRFVDFSEDFAVWVVFWGPAGGERA